MAENTDLAQAFFRYWGKAKRDDSGSAEYHLLVYHCLDVAAVASCWWDSSSALRTLFCRDVEQSESQIKAWMLFFIALHDVGKFDIRFQGKSQDTWIALNPDTSASGLPTYQLCREFDHGAAGLYWFIEDFLPTQPMNDFALLVETKPHPYQAWFPWIEAVTGHHGFILRQHQIFDKYIFPPSLGEEVSRRDKTARMAWLSALEALFLKPAGLSVSDRLPNASPLMAGFCSIADWLGSWNSEDTFRYCSSIPESIEALERYFVIREQRDAVLVLQRSGLLGASHEYLGVSALLEQGYRPRQLQVLVDDLPVTPGMTLIEAPTGSGKTETALAYAWKLIDRNLADSIIFALPTQATANAMLSRMDKLAERLFERPNLLLAHGNSRFNHAFQAIKQRGAPPVDDEEGWTQCCAWLAQSRKKVFLGQIGVCTIDQVLISVLPVKHRFIRGFGIGRSILIVDEVHAFDTYMNGLLDAVLKAQSAAGGSAILLSATLPGHQKRRLLNNYGQSNASFEHTDDRFEPYPRIHWRSASLSQHYDLTHLAEHLPSRISVNLEHLALSDMLPDRTLLDHMLLAARAGAQVCCICNLVDVAQEVWQRLADENDLSIDIILFHARFTLLDRQKKEEEVLRCFGKAGNRSRGRILISTQVIEQSLDVDFDWLITQHCPADLLFQRLGRLHRHSENIRPVGFEAPCATVLLPDRPDYGRHCKVYGNVYVLWRTQCYIEALKGEPLIFPEAYRQWLEPIYSIEEIDEPEWVKLAMEEHEKTESVKRSNARNMLGWAEAEALQDNDQNIMAVTRDGEMSLPTIPYFQTAQGRKLLNGQIYEQLTEFQRDEALALNRVNVPASWKKIIGTPGEDGLCWLEGGTVDEQWKCKERSADISYDKEIGMTRVIRRES